jgi:hypothetical protein
VSREAHAGFCERRPVRLPPPTLPIEADHSQLKHRLKSMRRLRTDATAEIIIAGHAFLQNVRRGHYDLTTHLRPGHRVAAAFTELAAAI